MTDKNLVNGHPTSNQGGPRFQCLNAATATSIPPHFEEASADQVEAAVAAAATAFPLFAQSTAQDRAELLTKIKAALEADETLILKRYQEESGYPEGRAKGEFQRTLGQIQSFVDLLQEGSYVQARIHEVDNTPSIRKMLFPIGPVVVFGASNFPLAFSTAGGDTISALAAGCPVVLKAHPYHAGTSTLVAQSMLRAISDTSMPAGIFSHLHGESYRVGQALVMHPSIKGVGFTGSFKGGKALYDLTQSRSEPIPVFAEMGSVNPIFICSNRLEKDAALADQIATSIALGCGQFCTNPGLIIIESSAPSPLFIDRLQQALWQQNTSAMVHPNIESNYSQSIEALSKTALSLIKSESTKAVLGVVSASQFLADTALSEEVFGPYSLVVHCENAIQMQSVMAALPGQLTLTLLADDTDEKILQKLLPAAREKAGRLLFEGVPTGVAVTQAMHHGGPFPATTDGRFTSVGSDAIYRWLRPLSYQDCPNALLPEALQKENPLQLWRSINGVLTQAQG